MRSRCGTLALILSKTILSFLSRRNLAQSSRYALTRLRPHSSKGCDRSCSHRTDALSVDIRSSSSSRSFACTSPVMYCIPSCPAVPRERSKKKGVCAILPRTSTETPRSSSCGIGFSVNPTHHLTLPTPPTLSSNSPASGKRNWNGKSAFSIGSPLTATWKSLPNVENRRAMLERKRSSLMAFLRWRSVNRTRVPCSPEITP